ncbi:GNAT family N-acetyltransferase [Piscibacillus halophilus]|uniref:Acetyltransferase (GNAT) family protein n=1 Tax=Piscibacillus halophilus TaxID=571933 RepID=A0A1H9CEM9_9BACI|nr:GNAT family N-acetyltransferase [Piscibacillus halophilus]SEP99646.1 Acetyltransferase (GNAT) family protein [Piscibacillus halophilus]
MKTRQPNKQDYKFIHDLCVLSYDNEKQWIGYPRVESLDVLKAEIAEYDHTLENCVFIIERDENPIGFTGYLFEPGDDEAYVIGPVFTEKEHSEHNVSEILEMLREQATFSRLMITTPSKNQITNSALQRLGWKRTHQQLEMQFNLRNIQPYSIKHPILPTDQKMLPKVAELFKEAFNWENAEERLQHELNEFGMESALIEHGEQLMGAILWDDVDGTNFVRLEDVAVNPIARRQGIASDLIKYVLIQSKHNSNEKVFLAVDLDNTSAIKLYETLGFKETMINYSYEVIPS